MDLKNWNRFNFDFGDFLIWSQNYSKISDDLCSKVSDFP
jgi:hypothetical protein